MPKIKKDANRIPCTHIPKDVATRVLSNPRNKLSNKSRKRFNLARSARIEVPVTDPKTIQEKYCRKLRALTLKSLGNQLDQARKQVNRFAHILAHLDWHAKNRPAVEQANAVQIYRLGWIEQEIDRRCEAKPAVPKKVAFPIITELVSELVYDASKDAAPDEAHLDEARGAGYLNPDGN